MIDIRLYVPQHQKTKMTTQKPTMNGEFPASHVPLTIPIASPFLPQLGPVYPPEPRVPKKRPSGRNPKQQTPGRWLSFNPSEKYAHQAG